MAHENRLDNAALIEPAELAEFASYGFFSFADHLEQIYADAPPIGSTAAPAREMVRFRANPTLGFPAEEISEVRIAANDGDRLEVYVNLLGLHGPSSPLPASYTERIIHADGVGAVGDFLDFFNHRLISLLLQIWRHYRYHLRFKDGATDPISTIIGALFGLVPGDDSAESREWRVRLLPHVGVLALHSRSARVSGGIVASHLNIPCRIEEFVWREIDIPEEAQWRLGRTDMQLGENTVAGVSMPDMAGKFRVCLGPLDLEHFRSLLPGGERHANLSKLIQLTLREPLAWDTQLILAPGIAPSWVLGEAQLGWTSLLDPSAETPVSVQL
jgi:type VI secretion system protein ImpH